MKKAQQGIATHLQILLSSAQPGILYTFVG